jgi:hypothetical protein
VVTLTLEREEKQFVVDAANPGTIREVRHAHSMGAMVANEALRQLAMRNAGQIVDTYVLSQSAMGADAYLGSPSSNYPAEFDGYLGGANPWFRDIDDAARKVVNFYNPVDYALNRWDLNNSLKPDPVFTPGTPVQTISSLPGFAATYRYTYSYGEHIWEKMSQQTTRISFADSPYEMFSYLARDKRPPLGRIAVESEDGPISVDVPLNVAPFNLGIDHSGQWNATIIARRQYWDELLYQFGLAPRS